MKKLSKELETKLIDLKRKINSVSNQFQSKLKFNKFEENNDMNERLLGHLDLNNYKDELKTKIFIREIKSENGCRYEGCFDKELNGYGKKEYPGELAVYTGDLKLGLENGYGTKIWTSSFCTNRWRGEFLNGNPFIIHDSSGFWNEASFF